MLGYNRLIFDSTTVDFGTFLRLIVSTDKCNSNISEREMGESQLDFGGTTTLTSWRDIEVMFNEPAIHIRKDADIIQCSIADSSAITRGRELLTL